MDTTGARPDRPAPAVAGRLAVTAAVAAAEAVHLGWEHAHGGIASHHLLADPALPALWNGWGLLVLPLLAWIASPRLVAPAARGWRLQRAPLLRLARAAIAGIALSVAFATGRSDLAAALFAAIGASALVLRLYRGEALLGFVLGMAWTFGALLPTLIGGVIALVSAAVWFGAWHPGRRLLQRMRPVRGAD